MTPAASREATARRPGQLAAIILVSSAAALVGLTGCGSSQTGTSRAMAPTTVSKASTDASVRKTPRHHKRAKPPVPAPHRQAPAQSSSVSKNIGQLLIATYQ